MRIQSFAVVVTAFIMATLGNTQEAHVENVDELQDLIRACAITQDLVCYFGAMSRLAEEPSFTADHRQELAYYNSYEVGEYLKNEQHNAPLQEYLNICNLGFKALDSGGRGNGLYALEMAVLCTEKAAKGDQGAQAAYFIERADLALRHRSSWPKVEDIPMSAASIQEVSDMATQRLEGFRK